MRDQLQTALSSRIVIEQAKGIVAETSQPSMDDAFQRIRQYARTHQATLSSVAQRLVEGDLRV
ncbi:ANTAR domain-containing protein [Cryobacterium lactosi]|uniref:ANTAR domain-containing protein n=1 Tax=Cryobacterium lactosi TaxID=1259202 RepID=UPI0030B9F8CC